MRKKWFVCGTILLGLVALSSRGIKAVQANSLIGTKTLILYDAASGAIPETSLMSFADFPFGDIVPTYEEGVTVMDTTIAGNESFAGWISSAATILGFPILDRSAGVQVNVTVQVESESHTRETRSGFSVIILDKDRKGIELSFGEGEIWAKSDDSTGGLFTRGEDAAVATTDMTAYQVTLVGDTYTLTANGQTLLTGPIRDYSAFDGFPDPYETANFLFLGDNTTSAQARIRLQFVSVIGSEAVIPTSTLDPQPTAVFTPFPQSNPTVLPTPSQPVVVLCPSGWIAVVGIAGVWMNRKFRKMI